MLESIWDYANEKLIAATEAEIFRIRHLDYFLRFAEETAPKIRGPEQREWLERVEQDEFNLRYALDAAAELPGQVSKGLRLLDAEQRFVEVRGLFKKAREVFDRLLALPDAAPRDLIRARALAASGRLAWVADDVPAAAAQHGEALAIFRELNDPRGTGTALGDLGFIAIDAGDLLYARALLDEAATLAAPLAESRLTAHVQHIRGVLAAAEGDFAQAFALDEESHALYRRMGDTWMTIIVAWAVGVNATVLGRFDTARVHLAECLQVGLDLGNRWGASYPLEAIAVLAVAERNYDRAARLFGAAEAQRIRSGLVPQAAEHPALRAVLDAAPDFTGPAVEAARREGRSLTLDDATALALGEP